MMTHFKAHQGVYRVSTKSFKCPICSLSFPKITKLNEHLSIEHNTWTMPQKTENILNNSLDNDSGEMDKCSAITQTAPHSIDTNFMLPINSDVMEIKKEKAQFV